MLEKRATGLKSGNCPVYHEFVFIVVCSLWWVQIVGYVWLADRFLLFVHYTISLSSLCKRYLKTLNLKFVECVSKIKHILLVSHYTICGAVCFKFTHFLCDDWDNVYTLSHYHHQIGSMNYYPLFRVRSWNNGMRCMSFYILMNNF